MVSYWKKLGLVKKFFIFFLLSSILPIILFSALFFHKMDEKLEQRKSELLQTGVSLAQEVLRDNQDKFGLLTSQFATFTLSEKYREFLETGNDRQMILAMERYIRSQELSLFMVVNKQGKPVVSNINVVPTPNLQLMVQSCLDGKVMTGLGVVPAQANKTLNLLAASPIISEHDPSKVIGGVLIGRNIHSNLTGQEFTKILPNLLIRIFMINNDHLSLDFTSYASPGTSPRKLQNLHLTPETEQLLIRNADPSGSFVEHMLGRNFISQSRRLTNNRGQLIGYMVVSTPQEDLQLLKTENTVYITFYFLLGLFVVTISGLWFKRTFINPMNELSHVSKLVSEGNLDVRVRSSGVDEEMEGTLQNFNNMLDQLHEKERIRKTFVSTLTHDLRTPLIAQKHVIEFFQDESLKEKMGNKGASLLTGLSTSNETLLKMVNQLLETYQYEDGKIQLRLELLNLHDLIENCLAEMEGLAQKKNIQMVNRIPQVFQRVEGDKSQLKRVFTNLIGNAIENIDFNDIISISSTELGTCVEIQVHDSGPGIEPDVLPQVFERYYSGQGLRQKLGSGLGLYICKMIIERHGGKIMVESDKDQGTTFHIRLPKHHETEEQSLS